MTFFTEDFYLEDRLLNPDPDLLPTYFKTEATPDSTEDSFGPIDEFFTKYDVTLGEKSRGYNGDPDEIDFLAESKRAKRELEFVRTTDDFMHWFKFVL